MKQQMMRFIKRYTELLMSGRMDHIMDELYDENVITRQSYYCWNSSNLLEKREIIKNYFDLSDLSSLSFSIKPLHTIWRFFNALITLQWVDIWTKQVYSEDYLCVFRVNDHWKIDKEWFYYDEFTRFKTT